jgi:hypothetical protein
MRMVAASGVGSAVQDRSHSLPLTRVPRRAALSIKPFVEFAKVYSVRDLRLLYRHINVADLERAAAAPVVGLQCLHPPRDRFVQAVSRYLDRMHGLIQIVETHSATLLTHASNCSKREFSFSSPTRRADSGR